MDNELARNLWTRIGGHAVLAFLVIVVALIMSSISYWHASKLAHSWIDNLKPDFGAQVETSCIPPGQQASPSTQRLEADLTTIQGRIAFHKEVMVYFYANYYRAIILASVFGAVSGICLFNIANKGWTNASNYVITTFVLATVIGAYFFSLISVFKEQDNISTNKAPLLQYVALRNRILTYCATGDPDSADDKTLDLYLHHVDAQMATINDIAVIFDSSKVTDYGALLQKAVKSEPQKQ